MTDIRQKIDRIFSIPEKSGYKKQPPAVYAEDIHTLFSQIRINRIISQAQISCYIKSIITSWNKGKITVTCYKQMKMTSQIGFANKKHQRNYELKNQSGSHVLIRLLGTVSTYRYK